MKTLKVGDSTYNLDHFVRATEIAHSVTTTRSQLGQAIPAQKGDPGATIRLNLTFVGLDKDVRLDDEQSRLFREYLDSFQSVSGS